MSLLLRSVYAFLFTLVPCFAIASDASLLGPQSSMESANSTTASPQTTALLQPAGTSSLPIQPADAKAGGIVVSGSQTLQETGPADQIKPILAGEGEGQQELSSSNNYAWLLIILGVLGLTTIITGLLILLERRFKSMQ